jgi:hypothetical protein
MDNTSGLKYEIKTLKSCINELCDIVDNMALKIYPSDCNGCKIDAEKEINEQTQRIRCQIGLYSVDCTQMEG